MVVNKAIKRDIMIWAFRDDEKEKGYWYLLGDCIVTDKYRLKKEDPWTFDFERGRLYPHRVPLVSLSFADKVRKQIRIGALLTWDEYEKLLEKANESVLESTK